MPTLLHQDYRRHRRPTYRRAGCRCGRCRFVLLSSVLFLLLLFAILVPPVRSSSSGRAATTTTKTSAGPFRHMKQRQLERQVQRRQHQVQRRKLEDSDGSDGGGGGQDDDDDLECLMRDGGALRPGTAIENGACVDADDAVFFYNIEQSSISANGIQTAAQTDIQLFFGGSSSRRGERRDVSNAMDPRNRGLIIPAGGKLIVRLSRHFIYDETAGLEPTPNTLIELGIADHNDIPGNPCPYDDASTDDERAALVCGNWNARFGNRNDRGVGDNDGNEGRINRQVIVIEPPVDGVIEGRRAGEIGIKYLHVHPTLDTKRGLYYNAAGTCRNLEDDDGDQDTTAVVYCRQDSDCPGNATTATTCVLSTGGDDNDEPFVGRITATVVDSENNIVHMQRQAIAFRYVPRFSVYNTNWGLTSHQEVVESVDYQIAEPLAVCDALNLPTEDSKFSDGAVPCYAPRFILFGPAPPSDQYPHPGPSLGFAITGERDATISFNGQSIGQILVKPPPDFDFAFVELRPPADSQVFAQAGRFGGFVFAIGLFLDIFPGVYTVQVTMNDGAQAVSRIVIQDESETLEPTTLAPTTPAPVEADTAAPTTPAPTTMAPTTLTPTTSAPTTMAPTSKPPTTAAPTTKPPTTNPPTTGEPTTSAPTTIEPTTSAPTTKPPTTPATAAPTTPAPTTLAPTTLAPTTLGPTTRPPAEIPTTPAPTTEVPTTVAPTEAPPTTTAPTTLPPSSRTAEPTTPSPTTQSPTTNSPTTRRPTKSPTTPTAAPTTPVPTTPIPTTFGPTTVAPTESPPTTDGGFGGGFTPLFPTPPRNPTAPAPTRTGGGFTPLFPTVPSNPSPPTAPNNPAPISRPNTPFFPPVQPFGGGGGGGGNNPQPTGPSFPGFGPFGGQPGEPTTVASSAPALPPVRSFGRDEDEQQQQQPTHVPTMMIVSAERPSSSLRQPAVAASAEEPSTTSADTALAQESPTTTTSTSGSVIISDPRNSNNEFNNNNVLPINQLRTSPHRPEGEAVTGGDVLTGDDNGGDAGNNQQQQNEEGGDNNNIDNDAAVVSDHRDDNEDEDPPITVPAYATAAASSEGESNGSRSSSAAAGLSAAIAGGALAAGALVAVLVKIARQEYVAHYY